MLRVCLQSASTYLQRSFFYYQLLRLQIYQCIKFYMAWLPDGKKFSKISLFILTQLTNVADTQTDRRTDGQTPHDSIQPRLCIASRGKNVQRKSCEFRFIRGFYVSISIRNILKGNLQPKLKVASVWPKSTAVITGVIFTCSGRAGFRLLRGLVYFARIAL